LPARRTALSALLEERRNAGGTMSDAFEQARDQRNALERLMAKIPGFRGYQDRELRRDVDRLQREHMAGEVASLKSSLRERARAYTDAGRIEELTRFDRLDRSLDGLSQSVRFADYGYSGFFDAVKIGEAELDALYRFDLETAEELVALGDALAAIPAPAAGESPDAALAQAEKLLSALEDRWKQREGVIQTVARGPATPES
jgi:hypothetical protein